MNFKKILERLAYWRSRDERYQEALGSYCRIIAPRSHLPVIGESFAAAFIDGVSFSKPWLKEWLDYWVWDISIFIATGETAEASYKSIECKDCCDLDLFAEFLERINELKNNNT